MILVITATINPISQDYLKLNNIDERISQYKDSLIHFINCGALEKIIVCDNSNYLSDNDIFKTERDLAEKKNINLELLSFTGNTKKVREQGKGYGEGEIMEYIFANSKLLTNEPYFFKVTGRLKVDNVADIVRNTNNKDVCLINIPNRTRHDIFDTRFYGMPVKMYKEYFLKAYEKTDDKNNKYLETVFKEVIDKNHLKHRNLPKYPRITGISGTFGSTYSYKEWKTKIKDVLSIFNYYGK